MKSINENLDDSASHMRLYSRKNKRLYINASERKRFTKAANQQPERQRVFCLTLLYTGCRLSEARELSCLALQAQEQLLSVRSLKKRDQHHIREIPIPKELVDDLSKLIGNGAFCDRPIWEGERGRKVDRITAYRWIKSNMCKAGIKGPQACPKGVRHGYGIHAIKSGIQLNMLQKWMGHASMKTTSIYANAVGTEELELAEQMWE